ncbi:MAG: aldo/keto reductase, partial [Solirubrobacteraceae bacterium]
YLNEAGETTLNALDRVASARGVTMAAVAVAWLLAQRGVTAPIASARTTGQLAQLLPAAELKLTADELDLLNGASATSR